MPYLKLKNKHWDIDVDLRYKYVLLEGDSGEGKSRIISRLNRDIRTGTLTVETDLKFKLVTTEDNIKEAVEGSVLFCDEEFAVKAIKYIKNLYMYAVCITRKKHDYINMSYKCIYRLLDINDILVSERVYKEPVRKYSEYDSFITEDAKAGHTFFKESFPEIYVDPAGSKDKLLKAVRRVRSLGYSKTLVICDGGGAACAIGRVYDEDLDLALPEAFEHILLSSCYLKVVSNIIDIFDIRETSTELFCEKQLELMTKDNPKLFYTHLPSRIGECWYKNCDKCNDNGCPYFIEGRKGLQILKDGPLDWLYQMLKEVL